MSKNSRKSNRSVIWMRAVIRILALVLTLIGSGFWTTEIVLQNFVNTLLSLGGRAPTRQVLQRVHQSLKKNLTPADLEELPSGQRVRWQENAEWERYHMVKDGLLVRGSPRGIWEITDEGRRLLEQGTGL